jgi:hypothetical protein
MLILWLAGCSVHTVDVAIDHGEGSPTAVAEIFEQRMSAVGARRYKVLSEPEVVVQLRPEDRERFDAILETKVLSMGWQEEDPFLDGIAPKRLECIDTTGSLQWAISLDSAEADMLRIQTELHGQDALVIAINGVELTSPNVYQPITGGTAMVPLDMSYRDCRVLSAQIMGGPLPAGVAARYVVQ